MLAFVKSAAVWSVLCSGVAFAEVPDEEEPPARTDTATGAQLGPQPTPVKAYNLYSLLGAEDRRVDLARRHAEGGSFPELLERVTRPFVGAPYLLSALGEGVPPDPDPRFRADSFDCTTFVETALAFARCSDFERAVSLLDRIRYAGEPSFAARRHLIVAQWLPGLQAAGFLEDITETLEGATAIELDLDEKRWARRRIARGLILPEDKVPKGVFRVPLIPIEVLAGHAERVPPGTLLNVVRIDVPWSPVLITHLGLVLLPRGETIRIVRHASPVAKRVVDEPLEAMLRRYLKPRAWKIAGINLQRIVDPSSE